MLRYLTEQLEARMLRYLTEQLQDAKVPNRAVLVARPRNSSDAKVPNRGRWDLKVTLQTWSSGQRFSF